jgi:D-alanyl-D-alanine carboxypeptidase/D-alanyl-D-alanine-endopeptidase (penicillin-binding protein 4)
LHQVNAFFRLLACALGLSLCLTTSVSAADIAESAQVVHGREAPLPAPVGRVMERYKLAPSGVSFFVQALNSDTPLLSFNADVPRNPASTIKALTTMVALDVLTPGYYWKTYVYLDGKLSNGRLDGNLILKGTGDPYLTTENFWKLLRELRARGLHHISGDLVVDNSYFQVAEEDPGAFDGQPFRSYNAPPDALLVNFKSVRFGFYPEPTGKGVRVVQDPLLANLRIDNRLAIRPGSCSGFQRGIAFNVPAGPAPDTVVFDGKFPSGCEEYSFSRTVLTPVQFAFGVFKGLWEELGGSIDGGVRVGLVPQADESGLELEPFYVHWSPTLAEVVRSINKYSNNVMTRHLLLTMGAKVYGAPGTEEKGRAVIADWLKANHLEMPGLVLVNGAGLSRDTRISAASLAALLRHAWNSPYMPEFVSSLPLSGMDGTLRRRFDDDPLVGQLHLKTGSMDDVAAIAGYATSRSGRRYVVVDLHNEKDIHRGYGENVQDALLHWVISK